MAEKNHQIPSLTSHEYFPATKKFIKLNETSLAVLILYIRVYTVYDKINAR